MLVTISKYIFLYIDDQGFEDCSSIGHFFIQFWVEGSLSNCHPNEIDVSLVCSGGNLKWKRSNVTKRKIVLLNVTIGDLMVYTGQWQNNENEVFKLINNVMLIAFLLILSKVCG